MSEKTDVEEVNRPDESEKSTVTKPSKPFPWLRKASKRERINWIYEPASDCKLFVTFKPWEATCPNVYISFANRMFALNFKYEENLFGRDTVFFLNRLYGRATDGTAAARVEECLLSFSFVEQYMNLYRSDRVALACHVTVRSISYGNHVILPVAHKPRYGIITIRSAASIAAAKAK